jgi:hypothetical protein
MLDGRRRHARRFGQDTPVKRLAIDHATEPSRAIWTFSVLSGAQRNELFDQGVVLVGDTDRKLFGGGDRGFGARHDDAVTRAVDACNKQELDTIKAFIMKAFIVSILEPLNYETGHTKRDTLRSPPAEPRAVVDGCAVRNRCRVAGLCGVGLGHIELCELRGASGVELVHVELRAVSFPGLGAQLP